MHAPTGLSNVLAVQNKLHYRQASCYKVSSMVAPFAMRRPRSVIYEFKTKQTRCTNSHHPFPLRLSFQFQRFASTKKSENEIKYTHSKNSLINSSHKTKLNFIIFIFRADSAHIRIGDCSFLATCAACSIKAFVFPMTSASGVSVSAWQCKVSLATNSGASTTNSSQCCAMWCCATKNWLVWQRSLCCPGLTPNSRHMQMEYVFVQGQPKPMVLWT